MPDYYKKRAQDRGIVLGLENITKLCEALSNPQDNYKIIHITGTNGKGSVGKYLEQILLHDGYKVGRFSSPAVESKYECITVNGENIIESDYNNLVDCIEKTEEKIGTSCTMFEIETAMAYLYFSNQNCEYVIIEVGMGGLRDSTNVCRTCIGAVFTPISMDHAVFLGDSIEKIAIEKSGIIKKGCKVFSVEQDEVVQNIISCACNKNDSEFVIAEAPRIEHSDISGTSFSLSNLDNLIITMVGHNQAQNASLAVSVYKGLFHMNEQAVREGLKSAFLSGRFELVNKENPIVIVDGAHNPHAAIALAKNINTYLKDKEITYIFGMFSDKDYTSVINLTSSLAKKIYCIKPPTQRGLDTSVLSAVLKNTDVIVEECEIEDAVRKSIKDEAVVCFGSLSTVSMIKKEFSKQLKISVNK